MIDRASASPAPLLRQPQFTLRQLMLGILLLCAVLAILVPAYRAAREHSIHLQCQNNLKQIGLGLHTYHDIWNCFPPAMWTDSSGKPMHSWRFLILPMLESGPYFDQYDMSEPWNGPKNKSLHGLYPPCFRCPEDRTSGPGTTNYVAITGPGTGWPGPNKSSRIKDFKDGLSNSIMVVEIRNSDIHWMEPRDLDISALKLAVNSDGKNSISSRHISGAFVLYGDGSVDFLNEQETESRIRQMVLIADEAVDKPSRPE
jgi:hypothetical protein